MKLDVETSTVVIGGRRFPAIYIICPPGGADDPGSDYERMLGGTSGPGIMDLAVRHQVLIPCENGVLVAVEDYGDDKPGYEVSLLARTCQQQPWDDTFLWMPYFVVIDHGRLAAVINWQRSRLHLPWRWEDAEAEWLTELIDRVSRMPFTQPEGPAVRPIPLTEAQERLVADGWKPLDNPV